MYDIGKQFDMDEHYYFDLTLEVDGETPYMTSEHLKIHVTDALRTLFGEVGASILVEVLKFDPKTRRAILRCPSKFYVKVHSSLSLCGYYEDVRCAYRIHKISPRLISLVSNTREFQHN